MNGQRRRVGAAVHGAATGRELIWGFRVRTTAAVRDLEDLHGGVTGVPEQLPRSGPPGAISERDCSAQHMSTCTRPIPNVYVYGTRRWGAASSSSRCSSRRRAIQSDSSPVTETRFRLAYTKRVYYVFFFLSFSPLLHYYTPFWAHTRDPRRHTDFLDKQQILDLFFFFFPVFSTAIWNLFCAVRRTAPYGRGDQSSRRRRLCCLLKRVKYTTRVYAHTHVHYYIHSNAYLQESKLVYAGATEAEDTPRSPRTSRIMNSDQTRLTFTRIIYTSATHDYMYIHKRS